MNNSFPRLIDGMCETLRTEVLSRLEDEFSRGQVFGVINLLSTFKVRADWSAGFLLAQIACQKEAFVRVEALLREAQYEGARPKVRAVEWPHADSIAGLLTQREVYNQGVSEWLAWLVGVTKLDVSVRIAIENTLRQAMREELSIELKNSSKPMFAQMSSGQDS